DQQRLQLGELGHAQVIFAHAPIPNLHRQRDGSLLARYLQNILDSGLQHLRTSTGTEYAYAAQEYVPSGIFLPKLYTKFICWYLAFKVLFEISKTTKRLILLLIDL